MNKITSLIFNFIQGSSVRAPQLRYQVLLHLSSSCIAGMKSNDTEHKYVVCFQASDLMHRGFCEMMVDFLAPSFAAFSRFSK